MPPYFIRSTANGTSPGIRLNPLVLIESIFLFVELLRQVQALSDPRNVGYHLNIQLIRIKQKGHSVFLGPGTVGPYGAGWGGLSLTVAPEEKFNDWESWVQGEIEPTEFAYNCVEKVYEWFGITTDKIPYVHVVGTKKKINIEMIKNLR